MHLLAAVMDSLSKRKQQDRPTVDHMDCEVEISGFKSPFFELLYIFEFSLTSGTGNNAQSRSKD